LSAPDKPAVELRRGAPPAADLLVFPVSEGELAPAVASLDRKLRAVLLRRAQTVQFRGRSDDSLLHPAAGSGGMVALAGVGKRPVGLDAWRRLGGRVRREADRQGARRVALHLGKASPDAAAPTAIAEGFLLAGYRFDRYKSEPDTRRRVERLTLSCEAGFAPETRAEIEALRAVVPRIFQARDLVNEPAAVATPSYLAEQAERLAAEIPGLEVEIWDESAIAREQLTGLLAVARGSREEPRFLRLRWASPQARKRVALVGKAITFDSGGLSLKPPKSMETMKYDMAGGATVIATVAAAAALRLPVEVIGYVPATENLPGGRAQKPGDVIRYRNGKTVEVLNTDAEGRLVLADGLTLASRTRPDAVIDLATLTGAARVALGQLYAAVLGNDQPLVDRLLAAGRATGEGLWQLPLVPEYREDIKSSIADLKNVGGGGDAGTIIGALFLQEFVDGVPWAHLDIAGPAFTEKDLPHAPRGGTGFGVRLLLRFLADFGGAPDRTAETAVARPAGRHPRSGPRSKRAGARGTSPRS
jgi:leucyl aminopeptidase